MDFLYKNKFLKRFDDYSKEEQALITAADQEIRHFYQTHHSPHELRIKKLYDNNQGKTFEARVSDKIRILWVEAEKIVYFDFIGSHDEVKRYIKSFR